MRGFKASSFLLLLILGNTLAWDACHLQSWRCGNTCIREYTECNCGGEIFKKEDGKWCCQDSPCTGKGKFNKWDKYYYGERDEEGREIGADCTGTALNLTQACNQTCNYYEKDRHRNVNGVLRSYVACNATNLTISQCIPEGQERDGVFDCRNRGDEEAFRNASSLLLDLENILTPCTDDIGNQGFKCSAATWDPNNCLYL